MKSCSGQAPWQNQWFINMYTHTHIYIYIFFSIRLTEALAAASSEFRSLLREHHLRSQDPAPCQIALLAWKHKSRKIRRGSAHRRQWEVIPKNTGNWTQLRHKGLGVLLQHHCVEFPVTSLPDTRHLWEIINNSPLADLYTEVWKA